MNVLLGIGLLAGIVFAVSWAIEPLWRRSLQDQKSKRITISKDALTDATQQVEVLERDLLEGVISPEDFILLAEHIRLESTALRLQSDHAQNLDTLPAGSMAEYGGSTDVKISASDDQGGAPDLANNPRARIWVVGSVTTLVVFAVLVIVLAVRGNPAGGFSPIAKLTAPGYSSLASSSDLSTELILLSSDGMLRSSDGGRNWREVGMKLQTNVVAPVTDGFLVAGNGMVKSRSDGGTELMDLAQAGLAMPLRALASAPTQLEVVAAVDAAGRLFRSADGGYSWDLLSDGVPVSTSGIAVMHSQDLYFVATLDQGVLAGDGASNWASANGFVNGALPTVRINDIGYDPDSGDVFLDPLGREFRGALYVATDVGLFKSVDAGSSWRNLNLPGEAAVLDVAPGFPNAITVVGSQGRIYRSRDNGITWLGS